MKLYTVGYGGRSAEELVALLAENGVRAVVDVRLRPDRASMGVWTKAKTPDKGIEKVLSAAGVEYRSLVELGNVFLGFEDWPQRYQMLLDQAGELLVSRLEGVPEPFCLLCAEKRVAECHRRQIADYLARTRGAEVVHLE
jgi:uncharacterized protein (DUF488 family)